METPMYCAAYLIAPRLPMLILIRMLMLWLLCEGYPDTSRTEV